ncbi:MAG TPA: hydantoinase/oxoprolinase family protein [Gemmatimonadaceae bacterium]|nr:hydantoinase/oxoprolinase family protein [Gemmatimonadaceae bacterium]
MSEAGVVGWDVGGVNVKAARVRAGHVQAACTHPYEIQRDPGALAAVLRTVAGEIDAAPAGLHAVTMTAELSQHFRTKREGVHAVLDAMAAAFPDAVLQVHTVAGDFRSSDAARVRPLDVAASNWAATARVVAWHWADALLIDIGTTTTDIIPIVHGRVAAEGRTDPERLRTGELIYLGAVRTPVEAIVHEVPLAGAWTGVSAEGFALAGDVHFWRGDLSSADYTAPTPDGRPACREFVRERLARIVCADREMLDDAALTAIADDVAAREVARIADEVRRVRRRHPDVALAVVAGVGEFLAARAAARAGLVVASLAGVLGAGAARAAPAAAVALLLERSLSPRDTYGA